MVTAPRLHHSTPHSIADKSSEILAGAQRIEEETGILLLYGLPAHAR